MSYPRPTLSELIARAKTDLRAHVANAEPWVKGNFEFALARSQGYVAHALYGFISWVLAQLFPETMDDDRFWEYFSRWGLERNPATTWRGTYTLTLTGGATVPAGTVLQSSLGGEYETVVGLTAGAGAHVVEIVARTGYEGSAYNLDVGAPLTLVTPIANVQAAGTVASELADAADLETKEQGLIRLYRRIRTPPSGGGPGDYEAWALEVSGVTRAGEVPLADGPGTVAVYFVRDADGDDLAIIPSVGEVADVQAYLDAVVPVTVVATAYAPTGVELDMTIQLSPNTAPVQAAVAASIRQLLAGLPVGEAHVLQEATVDEAISVAQGEVAHNISVASPAFPVSCAVNEVLVLGTVTWAAL